MTVQRRPAIEISRLVPREDDPPPEPGKVLVYVRPVEDISGTNLRTLARFPSGMVIIIL